MKTRSVASTPEELRDYTLLWRLAFPEKSRTSVRKWRIKNQEKRRQYENSLRVRNPNYHREERLRNHERRLATERAWRTKNKLRLNEELRTRRVTDINYRLRVVLRCRMNQALRKDWKSGSAVRLLGCSIKSFKIYLESKFDVGMSWENHGMGFGKWNIDHIIPCAIFDLSKPEHQQRCFHFRNLQPMWATENSSKGAKVPQV